MEAQIQTRLQRFRESFPELNIDTFLVTVEENRRYLSGFTGEDTQYDESAGALLITKDKGILATDSRFVLQARAEAPLFEIFCYREGLTKSMTDILGALKTSRLGFEGNRVSFQQHKKMLDQIRSQNGSVQLVEMEMVVENLRRVKQTDEIEWIKKALAIAESAFAGLLSTLRPGMTEKTVAWALEKQIRETGAESVSFPTIVASGPNSALPHAIPSDRPIRVGEPLLFDWGAKLNGYCSDISRTVCIGKPDATFQKVFKVVQEAQRAAISVIRPGVSSRSVDTAARDLIEKGGFKDRFGHGLGHGVGLSVHEAPRLSPFHNTTLDPGMVFTVEPGIYIPDWGGVRLENMVVLGENGPEVLNDLDVTM